MAAELSTPPVPFCEQVSRRFEWLDADGDGRITRADLAVRMQDRDVRGPDAAALATLRQALAGNAFPQGLTRERAVVGEEVWEQRYVATLEHLASPVLNRSLFRSDDPSSWWRDIHQGPMQDCWFVAAVIALARFRPDELRQLLADNGDGTYDVRFPGREPVRGVFVTDAEIAHYRPAHYPADGLLLPVLEKAYGTLLNPRAREPFEAINAGTIRAGKGIRLLTGHRSRIHYLTRGPFGWWQRRVRRLVEAAASATPPRLMIVSDTNFRTGHLHAVVGYDAAATTLTLQDPCAGEPRSPLPLERWVKDFTFAFIEA